MDFSFTEEQLAVLKTSRDFAQQEVLPKAAEIDREHRHPTELVQRMATLGVRVTRIAMGVPVGSDLEYTDEMTMYRALELFAT